MKQFYSLKIKTITQETATTKAITFEVPKALQQYFDFQAGQYITLRHTDKNGDIHNRCYSISSTPEEPNITIGVKKVFGGKVSPFLVEELKVGDIMEVASPEGNFKLTPSLLRKNDYVFIAGGSGITPIKSMITNLLKNEPLAKVFLIYGNQDEDNIIFKTYFDQLAAEKKQFQVLHCLSKPSENWTGEQGLLTMEKTMKLLYKFPILLHKSHFYICGPTPMMEGNLVALNNLNVPDTQIFAEYFTAATTTIPEYKKSTRSLVEIISNEQSITIELKANETILAGALRNNIALNYSCQAGLCSTCSMQLKSGEVAMQTTHGLTKKQQAAGMILTCQAVPTSPRITLYTNNATTDTIKRKSTRRIAVVAGLLLGILLIGAFTMPSNEQVLALGNMNTGHENLACSDCHSPAKGTVSQQVKANIKYFLGQRKSAVDFGLQNVDNKKCESCHERPNDRHPVYRFLEPRFSEVRAEFHPELCESCHREHNGQRIVLEDLDYCQSCHGDTELRHDPLDVPHVDLIKNNQWNTCLQCHDFHGNHVMTTATLMKDTIPMAQLIEYAKGGADPFGTEKKYLAEEEKKAIEKWIKK